MRIRHFIAALVMVLTECGAFGQGLKSALPDFTIVQYGGSIGYASGGFGYDVFESRGRFSTHFGWVPRRQGGTLNVVSAKFMFEPLTLTVWNRLYMNPFDLGVMASFNYGNDMESPWPEAHPAGYYWWRPAIRTHVVMENSVTYQFRKEKRFHSITAYIEFNTNEQYFISFIRNFGTVRLTDIVKLGTGVRLTF